jgi:type VI secretion system secreted protein VgrG
MPTLVKDAVSALRHPRPPLEFRVAIRTPAREGEASELLDASSWHVRSVQLEEELHAPYVLTLTLLTEDTLLEVDRLVGGELELDVSRLGSLQALADLTHDDARVLHGVVLRADYLGTHSHRMFVRVVVGPALCMLSLTRRSRIFQNATVVDIAQAVVRDVFEVRQRELVVDRLLVDYPVVDYCVQHRETDLEFLDRILADVGISYVWDHEGDRETMVLVDSNDAFAPLGESPTTNEGGAPTIIEVLSGGAIVDSSGLSQFGWSRQVQTAKHEARAWDWKAAPPTALSSEVEPEAVEPWELGEAHLHDVHRTSEADEGEGPLLDGTRGIAERAAAVAGVEAAMARGRGNLLAMTAGATFEVEGHPNPHLEGAYLATRVVHRAEIPAADLHETGSVARYENEVEAVPLHRPWRPRLRRKPRIHGPQLATVVGPAGEDIHTDVHGRVKVWLHWDREGAASGTHDLSCWVRVMHAWAGPGYGAFFLPRVGMEVVIAFIDGDPDRPLVTGCVHDGCNTPPVDLPDHKTRSTIRTRSSPPDGGFNELRFEDAAGKEEIYVHAQRNLREQIRAAQSTSVGATCSLHVGKTYTRSVGTGELIHVGKGETPASVATVESSREVFVDGAQAHYVIDIDTLDAKSVWQRGAEIYNVSGGDTVWISRGGSMALDIRPPGPLIEMEGDNVRIEAGSRIELVVGDTKLVLTPDGITLAASTQIASMVGDSVVKLLEEETTIEATTVRATASGNSMLELVDGEGKLETATAKIVTTKETSIDAGSKCAITGEEALVDATAITLGATDIKVDGSNVSVLASGPNVIKGKPVKIN